MTTDFIGRGEERTVEILKLLFPKFQIRQQIPIKSLLPVDIWFEFVKLGDAYTQHKHDIVLSIPNYESIIIEVNYQHGPIAESKWKVFKSYLEEAGHMTVTIDDKDCDSLFTLNDGGHVNSWNDFVDVIRALKKSGIPTI